MAYLFLQLAFLVVLWFSYQALPKKFQTYINVTLGCLFLLPFSPILLPYWIVTKKFDWDKNSWKTYLFSASIGWTFYGVLAYHYAKDVVS